MKWLYIYRDGKCKLVSAKTRSWERAEQKAREIRGTFDPIRQLQRRLEAQSSMDKSQIDIATAVHQFLKEVARLNRAEATRAKCKLTFLIFAVVSAPRMSVPRTGGAQKASRNAANGNQDAQSQAIASLGDKSLLPITDSGRVQCPKRVTTGI